MNLDTIPIHDTDNYGAVRTRTDLCVWHSTAGGTARSSLEWIARPDSGGGYHFIIERDGLVTASTPLTRTAWHAGISVWPVPAGGVPAGRSVNSRSIGIAFANRNDGTESVTAAQITAAVVLSAQLKKRYPAMIRHVRHRDVAPGRKTDPLPSALDWPAFVARVSA